MFQHLPTDNHVWLSMRRFYLQPVLVAAVISFLWCCYLALKPHLLLREPGQKGKLAWGHMEMRQACFRGPVSILAGVRAIAWVALYSKTGVTSSVTLACFHTYRCQSCSLLDSTKVGEVGRGGKTLVQKVWWSLMHICFLTLVLPSF